MEQIIETCECSNEKCRNNLIRVQPIKEFYDKNGKLTKRCLTCRNAENKYRKNPNSIARNEAKQKYQSTNHYKEIKKDINKRYLENHPEMIEIKREKARGTYKKNKENEKNN